jgi:hypothetical protein
MSLEITCLGLGQAQKCGEVKPIYTYTCI